jgi:hypothetical protein
MPDPPLANIRVSEHTTLRTQMRRMDTRNKIGGGITLPAMASPGIYPAIAHKGYELHLRWLTNVFQAVMCCTHRHTCPTENSEQDVQEQVHGEPSGQEHLQVTTKSHSRYRRRFNEVPVRTSTTMLMLHRCETTMQPREHGAHPQRRQQDGHLRARKHATSTGKLRLPTERAGRFAVSGCEKSRHNRDGLATRTTISTTSASVPCCKGDGEASQTG